MKIVVFYYDSAVTNLVWVGDIRAAVTGVSHAVTVAVQLVSVLDMLTVIQEVPQACLPNNIMRCLLMLSCQPCLFSTEHGVLQEEMLFFAVISGCETSKSSQSQTYRFHNGTITVSTSPESTIISIIKKAKHSMKMWQCALFCSPPVKENAVL